MNHRNINFVEFDESITPELLFNFSPKFMVDRGHYLNFKDKFVRGSSTKLSWLLLLVLSLVNERVMRDYGD